ncbi:uncharacterized protein GIQ15_05879 [Arthroderma uncinatum]|uniref:uncharacterized protein n=1 Tax=Arthroderma uncinatum TaxID=74035 RepID=UPI00144AEB4F|nr:uncharacterized protein GIQ15_05879 [Arthroderma uncinatum]KAF3480532.1 hypothetical protein GIQ15_05879 [Arthroderma uncinatum]
MYAMELLQRFAYLILLHVTFAAASPYTNVSQPLSDRDISINGNQYHSPAQPNNPARDPTCNHSDYEKIYCPAPSICYHQRGGAPACCPPDTNCDPPWMRDTPPGPSPSQPGAPATQPPSSADPTPRSDQANGSGNSGVGVGGSSRAENNNSNNLNVNVKNFGPKVFSRNAGLVLSVSLLAVGALVIL